MFLDYQIDSDTDQQHRRASFPPASAEKATKEKKFHPKSIPNEL